MSDIAVEPVSPKAVVERLRDWERRAAAAAEVHFQAAEQLSRWNVFLGIPVVVLSAVRREIEKARALPADQVGDLKQLLDDIKSRMDEAADKSPAMPDRRWKRALAKRQRAATRHHRRAGSR